MADKTYQTDFYVEQGGNAVHLPGALGKGYANLSPLGAKTTATASGLVTDLTTATIPRLGTLGVASGGISYEWASAGAGFLYFEPWRIPSDLSTADGLSIHYLAECASGATRQCDIKAFAAGGSTANLGTTAALSSTPSERTLTIASGSVPATGWLSIAWGPTSNATGSVYLYGVGLSYTKKTS